MKERRMSGEDDREREGESKAQKVNVTQHVSTHKEIK
jgi:hypothetical protein